MSKFLHHDAAMPGTKVGAAAERLGIEWPDLPFHCPGCARTFENHGNTIATLDVKRYEYPEETTFACMTCDLLAYTQAADGPVLQ